MLQDQPSKPDAKDYIRRNTREYFLGAAAHRLDLSDWLCPYEPGVDAEESRKRTQWLLGYYDRRRQVQFGVATDEQSVIDVTINAEDRK